MKHYSFDDIICRKDTNCSKIRALQALYGRTDLIPLWVADMDFATPPFILDALRARLEHPILGYTCVDEDYWPAIIDWQRELHGWEIKKRLDFLHAWRHPRSRICAASLHKTW